MVADSPKPGGDDGTHPGAGAETEANANPGVVATAKTAAEEAADAQAMKDSFDRLEQLLEFPVLFPLKVMGKRADGFEQAVTEVVRHFVPTFDPALIETRQSSKGSYLSLTMMLTIDSREQLEALHKDLLAHPMVKMVL